MKSIVILKWSEQAIITASGIQAKIGSIIDQYPITDLVVGIIHKEPIEHKLMEAELQSYFPSTNIRVLNIVLSSNLSLNEQEIAIKSFVGQIDKSYQFIYLMYLDQDDLNVRHMLTYEMLLANSGKFQVITEQESYKADYVNINFLENTRLQQNTFDHFHELVTSSNFKSASKLIEKKDVDSRIYTLLDFGDSLKSLNVQVLQGQDDPFDVLSQVLDELIDDFPTTEINFINSMKKLRIKDQQTFISFIYSYAEYLYEENELIDFIVLFYRLVEESLLYALGWDINDRAESFSDLLKYRKNNNYSLPIVKANKVTTHFHSYLSELKKYIRKIEQEQIVKIRRDKCVGIEKLSDKHKYFTELYLFYNSKRLEEFLDLRHEGVSGHGFADFTKDDFEAMLNGQTPLEYIDPMLVKLKLKPEHSVFKLIQKAVLGLVRKEIDLVGNK